MKLIKPKYLIQVAYDRYPWLPEAYAKNWSFEKDRYYLALEINGHSFILEENLFLPEHEPTHKNYNVKELNYEC